MLDKFKEYVKTASYIIPQMEDHELEQGIFKTFEGKKSISSQLFLETTVTAFKEAAAIELEGSDAHPLEAQLGTLIKSGVELLEQKNISKLPSHVFGSGATRGNGSDDENDNTKVETSADDSKRIVSEECKKHIQKMMKIESFYEKLKTENQYDQPSALLNRFLKEHIAGILREFIASSETVEIQSQTALSLIYLFNVTIDEMGEDSAFIPMIETAKVLCDRIQSYSPDANFNYFDFMGVLEIVYDSEDVNDESIKSILVHEMKESGCLHNADASTPLAEEDEGTEEFLATESSSADKGKGGGGELEADEQADVTTTGVVNEDVKDTPATESGGADNGKSEELEADEQASASAEDAVADATNSIITPTCIAVAVAVALLLANTGLGGGITQGLKYLGIIDPPLEVEPDPEGGLYFPICSLM